MSQSLHRKRKEKEKEEGEEEEVTCLGEFIIETGSLTSYE